MEAIQMIAALTRLVLLSGFWFATPADVLAQARTTWYLAEGATGGMFDEDILIANPNATSANILITFLPTGQPSITEDFVMLPTSRLSVRVDDVPGLSSAEVSAIVQSTNGLDILVERAMAWPQGQRLGGHHAVGVPAPAPRWYLAEGSTGPFDEFVLLANPHVSQRAIGRVTFLTDAGARVERPYALEPRSRQTMWINSEVPELQNAAFATVVEATNGVSVLAERAMYWGNYRGGHVNTGVTTPSTTWRFAEGFTGGGPALGFDTFLLFMNPGDAPATVKVTYYRASGGPVVASYAVPAGRRHTVWVDTIAGLQDAAFGAVVESDVAIIAERAMYFGPGGTWVEGHSALGATDEAPRWGFADGAAGGLFSTYIQLMNPQSQPISVRATFMREDGLGIVETVNVPAESRRNIAPDDYAELQGYRFSTFVESTGGQDFVAEQAVYWGQPFVGGHAGGGTVWNGAIATPPPAQAGPVYTETFPQVDPVALGSGPDQVGGCTAAIHDRYAVVAGDGRKYRTWHPITVPIDASNANGPRCTFAHEHGDPPPPGAPLPAFGYASFHAGMPDEAKAHVGFKVFSHLAGQRTGWNTPELAPVTPDWDTMVMVHQGTSGGGRLTVPMHSAEFWTRHPGGEITHISYMANTGVLEGTSFPPIAGGGPSRVVVTHDQPNYEIWSFGAEIGGNGAPGTALWSNLALTVAVTNPMNHMHGNLNNPGSLKLVSTSDELCGVDFPPCNVFVEFGDPESFWLGNMRTLHDPNWEWLNANGPAEICTTPEGLRQPSMAPCNNGVFGFIRQRIAPITFNPPNSEVWDRTLNGIPTILEDPNWMPLGAPAGG